MYVRVWWWEGVCAATSLFLLLLLSYSVTHSVALYEDQIGKFDWYRQLLGRPRHVLVTSGGGGGGAMTRILVATEHNVLAALAPGSGEVLWRRVYEADMSRGAIAGLLPAPSSSPPNRHDHTPASAAAAALVLSGASVLRTWNVVSGALIAETQLNFPHLADVRESLFQTLVAPSTTADHMTVYHLILDGDGRSLQHTVAVTGDTRTLQSHWFNSHWLHASTSCAAAVVGLVCADQQQVHYHDGHKVVSLTLPSSSPSSSSGDLVVTVRHVAEHVFSVHVGSRVLLARVDSVGEDGVEIVADLTGDCVCPVMAGGVGGGDFGGGGEQQVFLYVGIHNKTTSVMQWSLSPLSRPGQVIDVRHTTLAPSIDAAINQCHAVMTSPWRAADSPVGRERAPPPSARLLAIGTDDSVSLIQDNGGALWTREEALASVAAVEVVDLPISVSQISIEQEFGQRDDGLLMSFVRRLSSQCHQLWRLVRSVVGGVSEATSGRATTAATGSQLTRDQFNLNKMLVIATTVNKVFGLHTADGETVWKRVIDTDRHDRVVLLTSQRGTAHFGHQPIMTLLTGRCLATLDPITGVIVTSQRLDYQILQASLVPVTSDQHIKPLVILDTSARVHVHPVSTSALVASLSHKLFFHSTDGASGVSRGFAVTEKLTTLETWRADFSCGGAARVRHVATRDQHEHVHSQGRVLADRSVLYKYVNPNLIAIVTEQQQQQQDSAHKHTVSLYLVDSVSGHVIYSQHQRRARCPCHVILSENWLLLATYSDKSRRTELTSLELFEGKQQKNSSVFSSFDPPLSPMVERQSFILPAHIETMQTTITEKGITNKFILFGLSRGGVVEMNRALLDPRRPLALSPQNRPAGDDWLPPYTPELPILSTATISYNTSLPRASHVTTWPSSLESTCLVLVHGLDLFWTRVFPSKMFDQLKDDFDSSFIVLVLTALISVALVSRYLAQRNLLKQAWK